MNYMKNSDSGAAPGMEGRRPRIEGSAAYDTTDIPFPRFYVNQSGSIMNDQESPYPSILLKVIMIQVLNEIYLPALLAAAPLNSCGGESPAIAASPS